MYRLVAESEVEQDIEAAFDWYEDQQPGLGVEFLEELRHSYDRIATGPRHYSKLIAGFRRALLRRFPFGVYFVVEPDRVVVLAVLHLARDPRIWQQRVATPAHSKRSPP